MDWKPIATAHKDGRPVFAWIPGRGPMWIRFGIPRIDLLGEGPCWHDGEFALSAAWGNAAPTHWLDIVPPEGQSFPPPPAG